MIPYIIGISGGSGSGKTTFSAKLRETLGDESSAILYQDSYYIDQSDKFDKDGGAVNFDHPDAIEFDLLFKHLQALKKGEDIQVPYYDFATHKRSIVKDFFGPKKVILVDGILIFNKPEYLKYFDLTIFVDTPEDIRYSRRLARDTVERGRTEQGVYDQFYGQVAPMHDLFVEPSKTRVDMVCDGTEDFGPRLEELIGKLKI